MAYEPLIRESTAIARRGRHGRTSGGASGTNGGAMRTTSGARADG
jgi:hypothetical protein